MPAEDDDGEGIFHLADECDRHLFPTLLDILGRYQDEERGTKRYRLVNDCHQRFELWAHYIGVFANQSISLDNRLRPFQTVRNLILRLLGLLRSNLEHGFWFETAVVEPNLEGQAEDAPPAFVLGQLQESVEAALLAIKEAVDELHRIAVAIRTSSTSDLTSGVERYARKLDPVETADLENMALLRIETQYVNLKHSALARQLASSISHRRLRLLYERDRHHRLSQDRRHEATDLISTPQVEIEPANSLLDDADTAFSPELVPAAEKSIPRTPVTVTGTASIPSRLSEQRFFGVPAPETLKSFGNNDYPYPKKPHGKTCDWCFQFLPEDLDRERWKTHFRNDLKPYVCISEDCAQPTVLFATYADWLEHMEDSHTLHWARNVHSPQVWYCDIHDDNYYEFHSSTDLIEHLKAEHSSCFTHDDDRERRVRWSVIPEPRNLNECPICQVDVTSLRPSSNMKISAEEEHSVINKTECSLTGPVKGVDLRDEEQYIIGEPSHQEGVFKHNYRKGVRFVEPDKVSRPNKDTVQSFGRQDTDNPSMTHDVAKTATHKSVEFQEQEQDQGSSTDESSMASSSGAEDDVPPISRDPVEMTNRVKMAMHVAEHLKALAFLSIRYIEAEDSSDSGDETLSSRESFGESDSPLEFDDVNTVMVDISSEEGERQANHFPDIFKHVYTDILTTREDATQIEPTLDREENLETRHGITEA
ncbi:hypothetical protein F5Y14DRAFT_141749 [Nemania sp. NC0429]|nr:hypothetical protein F5Y14DRAFT_141749 [Nemania sp. NC0429]